MASPSGIPVLGQLLPGAHVGQLYSNQRDLVETLVPYFAAGLAQHERCVWVTAEPLDADQARAALAAVVPDLEARERAGEILIRSHEEWYLRAGVLGTAEVIQSWLDAEQQALADGYRGLRISGNTFWLGPEGWEAFSEYEASCHAAFRGRNIVALCSYPLAKCGPHAIVEVLRNHGPSLVRAPSGWELVHGATAALAFVEPAHEHVRDARDHLVLLHRLTAALGEATTHEQLAAIVRDIIAPALGAYALVVAELHDDGLATLASAGPGADTLLALARRAGERTLWSVGSAVAGQGPSLLDQRTPHDLRAFAHVPLEMAGRYLGALVLGFDHARVIGARYRGLVEDVARQLALALDRTRSYERLERERERAESACRAKDEFLAMLGHELRNPLSPILTATQLMRLRGEDLLQRERTVIERQVQHMIRLVDDLLDISRITRGKIELRRRPIELAEVVTQAVELASPAMEERSHRLSVDVPATGLVVNADLHRLAQVVANVLQNAAKYTPPGGAVSLGVRAAERTITIAVCDTGIGIDPQLLPHVFDVFVQGRQGLDRAAGGLGLGLAIARTLVELHGGTITASSAGPGRGSEFAITLARYANTRPRANHSGVFHMHGLRRRRVLVVDDNEDAALLFSEALGKFGHHVTVAHDGPSALELARDQPPEIAFLDIGLPVMDGYELGRRLRELHVPAPRLVAVTGYGHSSDRERSRDAGFDLHLVKPLDLAAIQDALAKLAT
jgi:signal transduction histidine kinase